MNRHDLRSQAIEATKIGGNQEKARTLALIYLADTIALALAESLSEHAETLDKALTFVADNIGDRR